MDLQDAPPQPWDPLRMVELVEWEPPWSGNQLRKLGRAIRDGEQLDGALEYGQVMAWYNDLAAYVQGRILGLNWPPLLLERPFEVTSRPKTIDTLRQKLQRDPSHPLQNVQDVAGVRFEAAMTLDEQDAVAVAICGVFNHDPADAIKDIRAKPHSGYRAVHVWLMLPARVEVQIRTHLQGAWANLYEAAADLLGRGIRYDETPDDPAARAVVLAFQQMSTGKIAELEKNRNEIARIELTLDDHKRGTRSGELGKDDEHRLEDLRTRTAAEERELMSTIQSLQQILESGRETRRTEDGGGA